MFFKDKKGMFKKSLRLVIINLFIVIVLIFSIEGFLSIFFKVYRTITIDNITERRHTEYDPELGWINIPNLFIKDLYGDKRNLTTNSQRFRDEKYFRKNIPLNTVRLVCTGNSYTLGHGVDDKDTWCRKLSQKNDVFEVVNMGQGGYGIGQSYLWFKRNSSKIDYNIHVFAFITNDFDRMMYDNFLGYGKPYLSEKNNIIAIHNIPVPKASFIAAKRPVYKKILSSLYTVKIFSGLNINVNQLQKPVMSSGEAHMVLSCIFTEIDKINRGHNSILIILHLPSFNDYNPNRKTEMLRTFVREETRNKKILFIDLIEELRAIPPQTVVQYFRAGHYSELGNAYIADILYRHLKEIPAVNAQIDRLLREK